MSNRFLSGINVTGTAILKTVVNAGADTDKFLVLDSSGNVDFRTGTELLSDIDAVPVSRTITINGTTYDLSANRTWTIATNSGTVTSVSLSRSGDALTITGSPITSSGTINIGFAGSISQYIRGDGTLASFPSLTGFVPYTGATNDLNLGSRNLLANNLLINNAFLGFASIVASATQVVLTVNSVPTYIVTGSGGQTIKLPDATTLPNGANYVFNNNQSSGALLINNNSNTLVFSIPSGGYCTLELTDNSIAAGSWDRHFEAPSNVSWSTNTLDYVGSITGATWNGATVAINRGGTGATTASAALVNLGGVPTSRTLTINGTAYDLSADRAWTIAANLNARTEYEFTTNGSSATYNATYSVGQVDVFYNGSKLSGAEFTATNGTSITLAFTPPTGQLVEIVAWETGGGVSNGRTLTINGVAFDLSANRSWTIPTHNEVTIGTANGLSLSTQVLSLALASTSTTGALSSTDWNTFNGKQAAGNYVTTDTTQTITGLKTFNVGASSSLKVLGTAYPAILIESSSSTQGTEIAFKTASNTSSIWSIGKRDDGINSTPVGSLWIYNGTTTAMWITPSNNFQFNGAATFSSSVTATQGYFSSTSGNPQVVAYYGASDYMNIFHNGLSIAGNDLLFSTNAGTERMRIKGGNVGIGQNNPLSPLSFANTIGNKIDFYNDGTARYSVQINGGELRFYTNQTNDIISLYAGNVLGLVNKYGNIGIGITSPGRKLHVYGSTSGVFDGILLENAASNSYAIYQSKTGNSNLWQWGTWNDNSYRVGTSGVADFLTITSGGIVTRPYQPFVIGGLDGNQSISLNTFTTLNFSTTVGMFYYANVGNCWNNSTRAFIAPVTGVYVVNVSLMTDSIGQVALHVNGARRHSIPAPPFTGNITWGGTALIPLTAGESLTLQGYGTSGSVTQNQFHTFFSIYLL
jgi:predicted heme/steroid binding protein